MTALSEKSPSSSIVGLDTPPENVVLAADHDEILQEAMGILFETSKEDKGILCDDDRIWEESVEMDELIARVQNIVLGGKQEEDAVMTTLQSLDDCFQSCDEQTLQQDRLDEFHFTEDFILQEQNATRDRQTKARKLETSEEKRLAAEVAVLKGLRLQSSRANVEEDLRWKISNAERSYASRKSVYVKAAQVAGAELRLQFARVRSFLEQVHQKRQQVLYKQHRRTLNFQSLRHALQKTDARVVSLDKQIAMRLFRKKKADHNEFHMARMLEEAVFLEFMMNMLDKVQRNKETAALEMFNLHVSNLKKE